MELELEEVLLLTMVTVEQVEVVTEQLQHQPQHKQEVITLVVEVEVVTKLVEPQVVQVLEETVVQVL